mgnify:CR=1 FL=1
MRKNFAKFACIILALCLVFSMTACGKTNNNENSNSNNQGKGSTGQNGEVNVGNDVNVDVNGTGGKNISSDEATSEDKPDQLKMRIMKDGRVIVPEIGSTDGDWSVEMEYLMSRSTK